MNDSFAQNNHHVTIAHIHRRTAEGEAVDGAFDWHAAFALEDFDYVERRLERRYFGTCLTEPLILNSWLATVVSPPRYVLAGQHWHAGCPVEASIASEQGARDDGFSFGEAFSLG
jgi:hypothetical protein